MREITNIHLRDHKVLGEATPDEVARSFAANVFRLKVFQPGTRRSWYPAIADWESIDQWTIQCGVTEALIERARPQALAAQPADFQPKSIESRLLEDEIEVEEQASQLAVFERTEHENDAAAGARKWREVDAEAFDLAAARERRLILEGTALGRLESKSESRAPFVFDVFANFVEWLGLLLAVHLVGAGFRRLANHYRFAIGIALASRGYAVRSHLRGARRAAAVGNRGETLRRLIEAAWHHRAIAVAEFGEGAAQETEFTRHVAAEIAAIALIFARSWKLDAVGEAQMADLLRALADPTMPGRRATKERLAKDLYKAALDHERSFSRIQLLAWLYGLARKLIGSFWPAFTAADEPRPLKRSLEYQGDLRALRHLRAARRKLARLPWTMPDKERLGIALDGALASTRTSLRETFGPKLETALRDARLVPETPRQRVAFAKIREELLDTLENRWHLRFPDLRDAIARNDLRLEDPSVKELLTGDELTQLDRILRRRLFGVYERAEIYIMTLQRIGTYMFATKLGRFFTRYVLLPYLGAYMAIQGFAHIFDPISALFGGPQILHHAKADPGEKDGGEANGEPQKQDQAKEQEPGTEPEKESEQEQEPEQEQDPEQEQGSKQEQDQESIKGDPEAEAAAAAARQAAHDAEIEMLLEQARRESELQAAERAMLWPWVLALGTVLLLAIYTRLGRDAAIALWRGVSALFRLLLYDAWRQLFDWGPLMKVLKSPVTRGVARYFLQPLLLGSILVSPWLVGSIIDPSPDLLAWRWIALIGFCIGFILLNSKDGRGVLDTGMYLAGASWQQIKGTLVVGLFKLIMDISSRALNQVEAAFYRVDDLLRFREGETAIAVYVKGLLQAIWSAITYLTRIYVNVLIEPQVNPIKHFPVVTVSHKLMIPWLPALTIGLKHILDPFMPGWLSASIAGITIFLLPGLFGFLVWEFKENWKLYAANHSARIKPVIVGRHGETMLGMLRRGFHSGTLPKAFDRLRAAIHAGWRTDTRIRQHAARARLHHAEEDLHRFLERELIASLEHVEPAQFASVKARAIHLATDSVDFEIEFAARRASADASTALHVLAIEIALVDRRLEATARLDSGASPPLDAAARRALVDELAAFFQRAAASFAAEEFAHAIAGASRGAIAGASAFA